MVRHTEATRFPGAPGPSGSRPPAAVEGAVEGTIVQKDASHQGPRRPLSERNEQIASTAKLTCCTCSAVTKIDFSDIPPDANGVPFRVALDSLRFADGTAVPLSDGHVLVLVGPNNSGKSLSLRDVHGLISEGNYVGKAVTEVVSGASGSGDQMVQWLERVTVKRSINGVEHFFSAQAGGLHHQRARDWAPALPWRAGHVPFLVAFAGAEQRLALANPTELHDALQSGPTAPLHYAYEDPGIEERLSEATTRAFGQPVTVNRIAGRNVHLHLGRPEAPGTLPPTQQYRDEIRSLPLVHEQGDGFKSFIGLLLGLFAGTFPIVLVDEPEAFLHPPQARQLGRRLAADHEGAQVLVATHSAEVLQGILSGGAAGVTVVRLQRPGGAARTSVLAAEDLERFWQDPLLRYSNALDGLFSAGVVLCEGDADCRFYQAAVDAFVERAGIREPDLVFCHAGGKSRIPMLAAALRAVDVPVRAIVDIDALNDDASLRRLVESIGGDYSPLAEDRRRLDLGIRASRQEPRVEDVRRTVDEALAAETESLMSTKGKRVVEEAVKSRSGWQEVKKAGRSAIPQGDHQAEYERLMTPLRESGIFVVPEGELEGWCRAAPGHGPSWVNDALLRGAHREAPVQQFVEGLLASYSP